MKKWTYDLLFHITIFTSKSTVQFQLYSDKIWYASKVSKICKIDAIWLK